MEFVLLWALAGLEIKHYLADYCLQWAKMIAEKPRLNRPGGYIHAGIHIAGTFPILLFCGLSIVTILPILAFEFVIHLFTDLVKARHDCGREPNIRARPFWIAHGTDQLIHQLTYVMILLFVVLATRG